VVGAVEEVVSMRTQRRYELAVKHISDARRCHNEGMRFVADLYLLWARQHMEKMHEGHAREDVVAKLEAAAAWKSGVVAEDPRGQGELL
jgi:hypothetical protein